MSQASDFLKHFLAAMEPAVLKAFDAVAVTTGPIGVAIDAGLIRPAAAAVEAHNPQYFTQPTHEVNASGSPVTPVAAVPAPTATATATPPDTDARFAAVEARVAALEAKEATTA